MTAIPIRNPHWGQRSLHEEVGALLGDLLPWVENAWRPVIIHKFILGSDDDAGNANFVGASAGIVSSNDTWGLPIILTCWPIWNLGLLSEVFMPANLPARRSRRQRLNASLLAARGASLTGRSRPAT